MFVEVYLNMLSMTQYHDFSVMAWQKKENNHIEGIGYNI